MTDVPFIDRRPDVWPVLLDEVAKAMSPSPTMDVRQLAMARAMQDRALALLREAATEPVYVGAPADDLQAVQRTVAEAVVRIRVLLEHAPEAKKAAVLQLQSHQLQALMFLAMLTG